MLRDVPLPSGATLKIQSAKFADAKALLSAATAEFRGFELTAKTDMAALYKELACIAFSAPAVEAALWKCMESCLYVVGEVTTKLAPSVFEPVERRDDFIKVCMEVAKENIGPFMKSLYAAYSQALEALENSPESKPETTPS